MLKVNILKRLPEHHKYANQDLAIDFNLGVAHCNLKLEVIKKLIYFFCEQKALSESDEYRRKSGLTFHKSSLFNE